MTSVRAGRSRLLSFAPAEDGLAVSHGGEDLLEASLEVPDDLLAPHDIERQRLDYEERGRRSTLAWSVGSAVLTAAVTLGVAWVNRPAAQPSQVAAPSPSFAELDQCRDSLERVATLAKLEDQTVPDLRTLIRRHDEACKSHLDAAVAASRP